MSEKWRERKELARQAWRRLRGGELTPWRAALSVGVGLVIGMTPAFGLHWLIVIAVCVPLRLDTGVAYLAANISMPFIAPFITFAEVETGALLLHGRFMAIEPERPEGRRHRHAGRRAGRRNGRPRAGDRRARRLGRLCVRGVATPPRTPRRGMSRAALFVSPRADRARGPPGGVLALDRCPVARGRSLLVLTRLRLLQRGVLEQPTRAALPDAARGRSEPPDGARARRRRRAPLPAERALL